LQFLFLRPCPSFVRAALRSRASVTNETKIKCKWKFIAAGDRRRFRTFKYFINFLLLLASVLRGSQERLESVADDRRSAMKRNETSQEWRERGLHLGVDFFYFPARMLSRRYGK